LSKSIHMTIKQVVRNNRENYGSKEYKDNIFKEDIEMTARKSWLKQDKRDEKALKKLKARNER